MTDDDVSAESPPTSRRRVVVIAAIVVVVILVVVFVVVGVRAGRSSPTGSSTAGTSSSSSMPSPSVSQRPTSTPIPVATSTPLPTGAAPQPAVIGSSSSPAPLASPAQVVNGVTVTIRQLAAVDGKGNGIGEIDGPAIRFEVVFDNASAKPVGLQTVVVSVTHGTDDAPANELESARTSLPQSLAPRSSATGVYTFTLARTDRKDVRISVDYRAGTPVTVFAGSAPTK